jgi:hypothetical protein
MKRYLARYAVKEKRFTEKRKGDLLLSPACFSKEAYYRIPDQQALFSGFNFE